MSNNKTITIAVPEEYRLERVDKFLVHALELDFSRSLIQKLIRRGAILVNGSAVKQNYTLKTDDEIGIRIPEPASIDIIPQDIPLTVIYQDDQLAVINKQPGLVVHPGSGNWDRTLVNALMFHIKDLSSIGGEIRPGIVHRLDKDTSGLMVIAKNDRAHAFLSREFLDRKVKKIYTAVITGKPAREHDTISLPIARHRKYRHKMAVDESGRAAETEFFVKKVWHSRLGVFSMLELLLHTGRTHQIRVHCSATGTPIVGDPIYSKKWEKHRVPFLLLASTGLEFRHPATGGTMSFSIELPEHIRKFIGRVEAAN